MEEFEEKDYKPIKYDHTSDLVDAPIMAKSEAEMQAYQNVSVKAFSITVIFI